MRHELGIAQNNNQNETHRPIICGQAGIMIGVSNLGKSYGDRTLFSGVSLQLNTGCRYGLVGANGSGKSTFLRIIAGDDSASEGSFSIPAQTQVGVLRQDHFISNHELILNLAMMGDTTVWNALQERERIIDHGDGDAQSLADLEALIANANGYTLEARACAILEGLGIASAYHRQPLATLSGGFKLRVLLAQVLVGGPDALFLDEPTNHLDILSIRWLETFLLSYRGVALVISHDQRFLDRISSHILDVDYGTLTLYTGNYTKFREEKESVRARKEAEIARTEKIIAEKRAFVGRFGAKATKAKQAQSRLKQIEKIEVEQLQASSRRAPLFRFVSKRSSGRDVLEACDIAKSYESKQVLRNVSLTIRRGEKIALIGPNGLGKSTLLKIIMNNLQPDNGTITFGHEVAAGYFAQDHHELLKNQAMTPLAYLWEACPTEGTSYVRGELGRALFSGSDVEKPLGSLSGGEAARVIFARIIVEKPNFLVLDEPTNHLDLEAIDALAQGLKAFEGTLLFVSHDRWFVSEVATRIIEITPSGIRDFPGTYEEYLTRSGDDHLDANAVVLKAKADNSPSPGAKSSTSGNTRSWEEQKRLRNRRQTLPAQRDKLIAQIEEAERRKKEITAIYTKPNFFESTPREEIAKLQHEEQSLTSQIEGWIATWEAIEQELTAQP